MITINGKEYKYYDIKISWGKFTVWNHGEKRTGTSPFLTFQTDEVDIGLEMTFSKEMFESLKIGDKTDIERYLTDILFEDGKGWISLGDQKSTCSITRKNEKEFEIYFKISAHDLDELFNIKIETTISLL